MPPSTVEPPFDQLLATAEAVIAARPEVDPEVTREIFLEAATLLDNGLVLDGLDAHDATAVVAGLCVDLLAEDPGAAIRARSQTISDGSNGSDSSQDLHDPASVSRAYLIAAAVFKL